MLQTVVETPEFSRQAEKCMSPESLASFITYISNNPLEGDLISGTSGVRKIRWQREKYTGKRSGVRIIYYYYDESVPLFLFTVYAKNSKENLTQKEKSLLKKIAHQIIEAYI